MKCPKCGYLGFETVDRCRNCGYDFSLTNVPPPSAELPLNETRGAGSALADLELAPKPDDSSRSTPNLDLDRLLGVESEAPAAETADVAHDREMPTGLDTHEPLSLFMSEDPTGVQNVEPPEETASRRHLQPIVPRPVGPPLAVRRASPEVSRGRSRAVRAPRREVRPLALEPEGANRPSQVSPRVPVHATSAPLDAASRMVRLTAAAIDVLLLGGIDAAVLYLTLQISGLTAADVRILPIVPMASFLLLLDGGYLAALTAAGGKTIGKMATGIRVIGDDGRSVDASGAVLRAIGGIVTVLAFGLPYLPAFFSKDGRTLADRLAGTRVVRD
jgi:uncharacterized RDD family membrane protein YckC